MHTHDSYAIIWCEFLVGADCSYLDTAGGHELQIGDVVPACLRWRDGVLLYLLPYFYHVGGQDWSSPLKKIYVVKS